MADKISYAEQIKHPEWQKKRLSVLEENNFCCNECGNKDEQLHVHHPIYRKDKMLWEYDVYELRCLCKTCHDSVHVIERAIKEALSMTTMEEMSQILGYIDSFYGIPILRNGVEETSYSIGYVDAKRSNTMEIFNKFRR